MQTAYPAMSSDSSIRDSYAMQSANAASALGAAFQYNSSAYGLGLTAGQPYNSGTRSISQSYKGSASMAQPAFNFAYSHFGNSGSQPTPPSYCYGGYPPNYGGSLSASAAASSSPPTSQNFASSCQQSVDYSHYGYNQGYYGGQPAYPHALYSTGNGSAAGSTSHSANGTPLPLTNSNSSSPPTYQLAQLPSPDTNNSSHNYHPSLENDSTPPLKASPLELPPANGNINNLNVTNKKGKSGRGRGRRVANASPPPEQTLDRVFIWDLDETLIHQHSLLNGGYAKHYHKSLDVLELLGRDVELLGYDMADNYFFGKDLEHCDQVHVDDVSADDTGQDLSTYNFETDGFADTGPSCGLSLPTAGVRGGVDWMRKLSFRYRKIRENYSHYCDRVGEMMGDRHAHWMRVIQEIENQTDCWTTTARKCLAIVNQRENSANILVSENQLVCAISKLLVNDLGQFFQIDNIYSSGKVGNKEHIFERIQQKYGKKCTYVVIGDTSKEEEAAKKLSMPFWRISSHSDLHNLHRALSLDML
ncbi:Eyes absent -like protein 4 [Halotydeus destructor]|nr:Eyes absent -like protein 4 [Halotydeus destructor]